jgi:hypothetical protein
VRRDCLMLRRFSLLAPSLALLAALLVISPTLSALRLGTPNGETLTGTTGKDHITGAGGNDTLKGLAGNDTYFFDDGWGADELVETPSQGTDTLNFRGVSSGGVQGNIIREWGAGATFFDGPGGSIDFSTAAGIAKIENVILGNGDGDFVEGGTGTNVLQPGGGATDWLLDFGGWNDGPAGNPELPVSNDVFKGFAANTGTDTVFDWGGSGETVDLRPFSTEDVYITRFDADSNGTQESLQIITSPTTQVVLIGHFGPYSTYTSDYGQNGRIEKLIFADVTFTTANGLANAASAEATSGKQADLADAAPELTEEARALLADLPEPGTQRGNPDGGDAGPGPKEQDPAKKDKPAKDKKQAKDKKSKPDKKTKDKQAKKQDKQGKRQGLQRQIERRGQGGSR